MYVFYDLILYCLKTLIDLLKKKSKQRKNERKIDKQVYLSECALRMLT